MQWSLLAQTADSGTNWPELLITALGASFVGGVLGGTLTTWLRGRIERDEAWRTRLIEAADEFMKLNAKAGLQGGVCLHRFKDPGQDMMRDDGTVTDTGRVEIQLTRDANTEARIGAYRVGLLFGPHSDTMAAASALVFDLRMMLNTLQGVEDHGDPLFAPVSRVERIERAESFFHRRDDDIAALVNAVHHRLGYAKK